MLKLKNAMETTTETTFKMWTPHTNKIALEKAILKVKKTPEDGNLKNEITYSITETINKYWFEITISRPYLAVLLGMYYNSELNKK